ncbi:hypothetical protein HHK36_008077 [Tetracentron sinense]|uniref:Histone H2A n=1 Tax=Tetracentron sinense TaxID=13715 RepID=A0A834ZPG4_TETSI|nr:hypothetical protein HHK36_008077 [Tetracentron sinense]
MGSLVCCSVMDEPFHLVGFRRRGEHSAVTLRCLSQTEKQQGKWRLGFSKPERVGVRAPVYLSVVLKYLAVEVLELAGNAARDNRRN